MAKNDIRLLDSDDYGPFSKIAQGYLNASETFGVGEPVFENTDGEVAESGDDPTPATFAGISLSSGDTVGASDPVGTFRRSVGQFQPGLSPNTPQTGDPVLYRKLYPGARIACDNFATDGAGTLVTPTTANAIGEQAGFTLASGTYSIDTGTTNEPLRIVGVLDANGDDIRWSGGTGVTVVAEVVQCQFSFEA